ncbi:MAG: bacillithiol biosynthesis deacetylase BshB1 [Planctomycetes bacterium]|nr:bacillithiol biosynthesis deacetylase BshB1 [Planctomycetota bacterium]
MPDTPLDCLVIAPHPDDAELGMAGTIMRMQDEGLRVGVLDLTSGEPTPRGSPEIRARETAAATKVMGLAWRENLGLPNRSLEATLENRAKLAAVFRRARPRTLFAPYWVDAHPDHVAATELIEAARFWSKLTKTDLPGEPHHPSRVLYYFCVHLRVVAQPAFVVDISPYWERKRAAIECYQSQFITGRPTAPPTFMDRLRDQAAYWGWAIDRAYGEPFASREAIGVEQLRGLI